MGVDLTLLPFEHDGGDFAFSHTILRCIRRRDLWEVIQGFPTKPVPTNFHTYICRDDDYAEPHYGNTQEDPYGEQVAWVLTEELMLLRDHEAVQDIPRNRAIWAYLQELEPRTKIALYWH